MKKAFAIIIVLIAVVSFSHESIINNLPHSEFKYKWQLYMHSNDLEMLIEEAEKTPYGAIHFEKDYRNDPDFQEYSAQYPDQDVFLANDAYLFNDGVLKKVEKPDIQNFIDAAETTGLSLVRLTQRSDRAGWMLYHSLSWSSKNTEIRARYVHGPPPNNSNCKKLKEGKDPSGNCHTHLFGDWYLDKWWRTN